MIPRFITAFLAGLSAILLTLLLAGCSSQSVSDFTPYPSAQGTASVYVLAEPTAFPVGSAAVHLTEIEAFLGAVGTSVAGSTSRSRVARAIAAHTHEEEAEPTAADPAGGSLADPNRETADGRPLVSETRPLQSPRFLAEHQSLGTFGLKAGTAMGWHLRLEPGPLSDGQTASLRVKGHIHLPTGEVPLTVRLEEPVSLAFSGGGTIRAEECLTQVLVLQADRWFTGIALETLAAQGPVRIDAEHEDLLHSFHTNLGTAVGVEAALHPVREDEHEEHHHEE